MSTMLSASQLAKMIDHTLLDNHTTNQQLKQHCETAIAYGFKTVAINNAVIPFCAQVLKGSDVLIDAAVSFPLGQCTIETKVFETRDAIAKGAGEVDYVINLVEVKNGNWDYIRREMQEIVAVCRAHNVVSKVILETCYLTHDEKIKICEIAAEVRPDFVKTSTGFGTGGATVEDIVLMKSVVKDAVGIKASGGVRTIEQALAMIEAGATRIGTSKGCDIIDSYKERLG